MNTCILDPNISISDAWNQQLFSQLSSSFKSLEETVTAPDVSDHIDEVWKIVEKILLFKDQIPRNLSHDFNNDVMVLALLQTFLKKWRVFDAQKFLLLTKENVKELLLGKNIYSESRIFEILEWFSHLYWINIECKFWKRGRIFLFQWKVIFEDDIEKEENFFMDFPLLRVLQNLLKNSKEAWSLKVKIKFIFSEHDNKLHIEYEDNGEWMEEDFVHGKIFSNWITTKWNSWTNKWEGMYYLAQIFWEKKVNVTLCSRYKWTLHEEKFPYEHFVKFIEEWWEQPECDDIHILKPFKPISWTKFIFSIPLNRKDNKE